MLIEQAEQILSAFRILDECKEKIRSMPWESELVTDEQKLEAADNYRQATDDLVDSFDEPARVERWTWDY